ncbi:MAG: hypothetical protein ABR585_12780 [Gemmatimonadaceae bacterium]|nr:hypothetical protein [Actinomycetota bacterium]
MKITEHTPEPQPLPPTTYSLTELTEEELKIIRNALYNTACGRYPDSSFVQVHCAQELHKDIFNAIYGCDYIGGYAP